MASLCLLLFGLVIDPAAAALDAALPLKATLLLNGTKHCDARGGCDCDCAWAKDPSKCRRDDGTCCWGCCCPPAPAPSPAPGPSGNGTLYCPGAGDWNLGDASWDGDGWTVHGPGGVHGKTSFNLLDGYVEFEMDTTGATAGTNTNFYTSSPEHCCGYCDIQKNKSPQCMEMDIIEANGNCAMQSTWHTDPDHGGGCDEGGCAAQERLPGAAIHMRAAFGRDGAMTVFLDGKEVTGYSPAPQTKNKDIVRRTMRATGAMFHSTQWQGWVPSASSCPGGGSLAGSKFSVRNVKVMGVVVQGQEPRKCD